MENIEKASDTEVRITKTETIEQVVPLKQLKRQRDNLLDRKTAIEDQITSVDVLIAQAENLGVVETVLSE